MAVERTHTGICMCTGCELLRASPEPPDGTVLYWPDGEYSRVVTRSDTHAPTPDRRWFQPNDTSMAAATWPDLVQWLEALECPLSAAITLRPAVTP
jgi:hypothetical protein